MKSKKTIYWISTTIMCAIFLFSSGLYIFGHDLAASFYRVIGFPTWLLYPSAVIKIAGVVAVLSRKSKFLKEWAYAGFFFDVLVATAAHLVAGDGQEALSAIALVATVVSRMYDEVMDTAHKRQIPARP